MSWAVADGQVITIASNAVDALLGTVKGYRVELHALPGYVFKVEAPTGDAAVALAVATCRREGKRIATDAATFQAIDTRG